MVSSLIQASCTVRQTLTSLQDSFYNRMGFVLLEKLIWVDIRILIVQTDYCSYVNQIWTHMIHKGTTIDISWERPVYSMLNQTLLEVRIAFCDSPHLLKSDSIVLYADIIFLEIEILLNSLCKWASASFSQYCLLSFNLYTRWIISFLRSILCYSKISSYNSSHASIFIVNDLITCNAWQNINTHWLCLFTKPWTEVAKTDNIVAMIVDSFWEQKVGNFDMLIFK